MSTVHTNTTHTCSYLCHYTQALLAYADQHKEFADWLLAHIPDYTTAGAQTEDYQTVVPSLIPQSDEAAQRRTQWLLNEVALAPQAEREHVYATLAKWSHARPYEKPKAVVLGITIGVLPVGLFGEVKRKHEPMAVIVRRDLRERIGAPAFLRDITKLTTGVVELGLHQADGHTARLEPELGDWLFGEKTITLYTAPHSSLKKIEQQLAGLRAPHAVSRTEQGTVEAIAMTPAFYAGDLDVAETLEQIVLGE